MVSTLTFCPAIIFASFCFKRNLTPTITLESIACMLQAKAQMNREIGGLLSTVRPSMKLIFGQLLESLPSLGYPLSRETPTIYFIEIRQGNLRRLVNMPGVVFYSLSKVSETEFLANIKHLILRTFQVRKVRIKLQNNYGDRIFPTVLPKRGWLHQRPKKHGWP